MLLAIFGPNPLLVGYLLFAGLVWVLLSTGVVDQCCPTLWSVALLLGLQTIRRDELIR